MRRPRLLLGSYGVVIIATWVLWIQGWDLGLITSHHTWWIAGPAVHGLFISVGVVLAVLSRVTVPFTYLLIDAAIAISSLVLVPVLALNQDGEGWFVLGFVYLGATLVRSYIVLKLHYQVSAPLSNRWLLAIILPVLVILLSLQVWRWEISPLKGDEPYYLMITHSVVEDGDLKIDNNFHELLAKLKIDAGIKEFYFERHGQKYAVHPPGLPLFLVPGYVVGGARGALAMLALASALLLSEWLRLARVWKVSNRSIVTFGYLLFFTYPLSIYALNLYPEVLAALVFTVMVRLGLERPDLVRLLVGAVGVLILTTIKVRFLLLGLPIFLVLVVRYVMHNRRGGLSIGFVLLFCAGLLTFYHLQPAGFIHLYHRVGELLRFRLVNLKPYQGLFGLLLDQQFGLLWRNPLYLLGLFGMTGLSRKQFPHKWLLLLAIGPYIATVAAVEFWTGGSTPPARFLVPILPVVGLFALPIVEAGFLRRLPGLLMISGALVSTVMSLVAPQFDIYSVDPVMGVARSLNSVSQLVGYPITRFFPSYFRTGITTHIWSVLLLLIVIGASRLILKPSRIKHSDRRLRIDKSRLTLMSLTVLLLLMVLLVTSIFVPPLIIYPQDAVYPQESGFPSNDSFLMGDRYTLSCKTFRGPQTLLVYASDESESLLGTSVMLEIDEQKYQSHRVTDSQVQPVLWRFRGEGGVHKIMLKVLRQKAEATPPHESAVILKRLEVLPSSPLLASSSRWVTKLLGPLWSSEEQRARAIRTYLLDATNGEAAQEVIKSYLDQHDIINLTPWIADLSPEVIKRLPPELRVLVAQHLSFRRQDNLVLKLLDGLSADGFVAMAQELRLLAELRRNDPELTVDYQHIADTTNVELKYRSAMWFLDHNRKDEGLRLASEVLKTNNQTYNQLILIKFNELGLKLPEHSPPLSLTHQVNYTSNDIKATAGVMARDGWHLTSNGSIAVEFPVVSSAVGITLRLRGSEAQGQWPEALLHVDGQVFTRFLVTTPDWLDYSFVIPLAPGPHLLELEFTNDFYYAKDAEDRNLFFNLCLIDTMELAH